MSHNNAGLDDILDVKRIPETESTDASHPNGLVTVTLTPDEYQHRAAERVRQLFPHAQHIIEKSTMTDLDGKDVEYEKHRYRCTFPTIVAARQSCRQLETLASVRIEAPITLDEEELEALAEYHAYNLVSLDWFMSVRYSSDEIYSYRYHNGRLNEVGRVLGQEALRRIYEETIKQADRRAAYIEGEAREEGARRRTRSTPRRRRKSALKRPASGRTRRGPVPLAAKVQRPKTPGNDRSR